MIFRYISISSGVNNWVGRMPSSKIAQLMLAYSIFGSFSSVNCVAFTLRSFIFCLIPKLSKCLIFSFLFWLGTNGSKSIHFCQHPTGSEHPTGSMIRKVKQNSYINMRRHTIWGVGNMQYLIDVYIFCLFRYLLQIIHIFIISSFRWENDRIYFICYFFILTRIYSYLNLNPLS